MKTLGCEWIDATTHNTMGINQVNKHKLRLRGTLLGIIFAATYLCYINAAAAETPSVPSFVNDPAVLGSWRSVDFVPSIDEFIPGQQKWQGDLYLKGIIFKPEGSCSDWWRWSKGHVWDSRQKNVGTYEIKDLSGKQYLFLEWINGDVTIRGDKPSYYVLERGKFRDDPRWINGDVTIRGDKPSYYILERLSFLDDPRMGIVFLSILTNLGCGLLFIAISIPLVQRKIPMNTTYGFRLQKAFLSDTLWYDINAYGGKQMILCSLGMIVTGIASYALRYMFDDNTALLLSLVLTVGPMLFFLAIALIRTLRYASKLQGPEKKDNTSSPRFY